MRQLPRGWEPAQLGNVVQLKTGPFGSALHQSDYVLGGTPLINPTHIRNGRLAPDPSISTSSKKAAELKEYKLATGDVVMGRRGEMGRCAVVPQAAEGWLCGTGSVIVRPSPAVLPAFLQRFLSAPVTVAALVGDSVGSTMVNLNQKILLSLPLGLPPEAEQKRIADKLDNVLTRVDAVNTRLARVAPILKRFRQSVLAAATSGRLTEDWRMGGLFGEEATVGDIADARAGVGFPPSLQGRDSGELPFAKVSDISKACLVSGGLLASAANWISYRDAQALRCKPVPVGATVFAKIGEGLKLNRRALCEQPCLIDNNCMALVPREEKVIPRYLYLFMQTVDLGKFAIATAVPSVRRGDIDSLSLLLPSKDEQTEIVRRVETLFAFTDRLEARLQAAQTATERLTPALLAKAFRGELVPQDPNDEPALALLERMRTAENDAPARKAAGPRGRPRQRVN